MPGEPQVYTMKELVDAIEKAGFHVLHQTQWFPGQLDPQNCIIATKRAMKRTRSGTNTQEEITFDTESIVKRHRLAHLEKPSPETFRVLLENMDDSDEVSDCDALDILLGETMESRWLTANAEKNRLFPTDV